MVLWYNLLPMSTSNKNSKSILAKVLATENITVEFDPSAKTAKFDIANRRLSMPVLKEDESECVTDMFIGHECAHALYSPYREKDKNSKGGWWIEAEEIGGTLNAMYVQDIMNIVEDVRIEKLMKEKFPGLGRDFNAAYRELADRDFFDTKGIDINTLSFVDRMNLHFKCGSFMNIAFSNDEQTIVDLVDNAKTFDDVINASTKVFEFVKGKKINMPEIKQNASASSNTNQDEESGDGESSITVTGNSTDKKNEQKQSSNSNPNPNGVEESETQNQSKSVSNDRQGGTGSAPDMLLPRITTQKAFDEKSKTMINNKIEYSTTTTLPVPDLKKIIFPYSKTHEAINEHYINYAKHNENAKLLAAIKESYSELIKSVNPMINTLIKQFEMKKAADLQKRTSISRTGKIDCDRIFKYKVTDDIFSRFSKIAEGKNHGLVMYVDWSSSMQGATDDVLTQIIMMVQFCRRMGIPFDVYMFTSHSDIFTCYGLASRNGVGTLKQYKTTGGRTTRNKHGSASTNDENEESTNLSEFALIHFLSSSMTKTQLNDAMYNTYLIGKMITGYGTEFGKTHARRSVPNYFSQGNTPLDPAILCAMYMVPEFQEKHKVQIMNTIFLTDGESGYSYFTSYSQSDQYYSERYTSDVISPINKKSYRANDKSSSDTMLRIFREVTGSNAIGFYIAATPYCRYTNDDSKDFKKTLKEKTFIEAPKMLKEKFYNYTTREYELRGKDYLNHGYDRLFILPNHIEMVDDLEDLNNLNDNASLVRIRNTFMKSVEKRGNSRAFLNRFADVIANPSTR